MAATYVLVHGAWDGGWKWQPIRRRLVAAGADVYSPSLTGSGERVHLAAPTVGLDTYADDIVNLLVYEDLRGAILVGYSFSGMAVTAAAAVVPGRIGRLVYLDAFVPRDGQAFVDLVPEETARRFHEEARVHGDGWRIPAPDDSDPRVTALPLKTITDRVRVDEAVLPPRTYIRCVSGEPGGAFDDAAGRAQAEGWRYFELRSSHNPMLDVPDELTALLLAIGDGAV